MAQKRIFGLWMASAACLLLTATAAAARLQPKTIRAFDAYVRTAENQMAVGDDVSFVWLADTGASRERLRNGEILIHHENKGKVPDGIVHDWTGSMFIRGVSVDDVVETLLDFNRHKTVYPEVVDSRVLEKTAGRARTFLRIQRTKIVTVVYNTEYDLQYVRASPTRWQSRSHSTRIAQIDDAGEPGEKEMPVGNDSGYLWRLNAYWRIETSDGGSFVSCRAISLSRGIPFGLGWLVKPFVSSLPRESLLATLDGTRNAVLNPDYVAVSQ